jgi:hypothetical protein
MDTRRFSGRRRHRRGLSVTATTAVITVGALVSSPAGASSRLATFTATTSSTSGAVLIGIGAGVLALGGIGIVIFTWSRRKRRPGQCAEQREALALAERAVQYWEGARAHLEAAAMERTDAEAASDGPSHEAKLAKSLDGLNAAKRQRDQCQLDLIHCMASGTPAMRPAPLQAQPFFTPGPEGTAPPTALPTDL